MMYLGNIPIAGTGSTPAERRAKQYTDEQFVAARSTAITVTNSTPVGEYKENDVWFITDSE